MYFGFSIASIQEKVLEDQNVSMPLPSDQICEGAEEGSALIVEKIIKVSEVIFEETGTGSLGNEGKLEAQNSIVEAHHGQNGLFQGAVGQVTEHCQVIFNGLLHGILAAICYDRLFCITSP